MANLKIGWLAAGVLAIAFVVVAVLVYARYRRDIHSARERLKSGGSQIIETDCGPIEYATFGDGHPLLVVHGILGGVDQGLVIARGNVGDKKIMMHVILSEARAKDLNSLCEARFFAYGSE